MITLPHSRNCGERCGRVHGVSGKCAGGSEGSCGKRYGRCMEVCWGVGGDEERCVGRGVLECTGMG